MKLHEWAEAVSSCLGPFEPSARKLPCKGGGRFTAAPSG